MLSVAWAPSAPWLISWLVMTPSISTWGRPLIVATSRTRTSGMLAPPASKNSVCNGELVVRVNCNWKTLGPWSGVVTCTWVSASRMSAETGTGTAGPIIKVRCTPLSTRRPRNAFRQGDAELPARRLGQLFRADRPVRVADAPELLRVADIARGQVVQPVAARHRVLLQQGEALRLGHEPPPEVGDRLAVRRLRGRQVDAV